MAAASNVARSVLCMSDILGQLTAPDKPPHLVAFRPPLRRPEMLTRPVRCRSFRMAMMATALASASMVAAQRGPAPDPLVRENATVKLGPHTHVIPDANVGMVPNVGIV